MNERKIELKYEIKALEEKLKDLEEELKESEDSNVQINIARGNGKVYASYSIGGFGGMSPDRIKRKIEETKSKLEAKKSELARLS